MAEDKNNDSVKNEQTEEVDSIYDKLMQRIWIPGVLILLLIWYWFKLWPMNESLKKPDTYLDILYGLIGGRSVFGLIKLALVGLIVFAILSIIKHIWDGRWIISISKSGINILKEQQEKEAVAFTELVSAYEKRDEKHKKEKAETKTALAEATKALEAEILKSLEPDEEQEKKQV